MASRMSLKLHPAADEPTLLRTPTGVDPREDDAALRGNSRAHDANITNFEFSILSGVHRGATFSIGADDLLVIGADPTCDIYLSDPGVAPRHAAITFRNGAVSIRSLDGALDVDGQTINAAARVSLAVESVVAIGASNVKLQLTGPGNDVRPAAPSKTSARKGSSRRIWVFGLAFLALTATAVTQLAGQEASPAAPQPRREADATVVQSLLQREGVSQEVEVSSTTYGTVLNGVIDAAAAAALSSALAKLDAPVINAIVTTEEFLEQVRDVFRVHGYEADVTYLGRRRVRVENLDEHHERVRRAAARVRTDVSQLAELSFAAPGAASPPDHAPAYDSGSGARISVRIDGDAAYLATTGGGRYFEGSLLPSGHTVRRITPNAVQLDLNGRIEWFSF